MEQMTWLRVGSPQKWASREPSLTDAQTHVAPSQWPQPASAGSRSHPAHPWPPLLYPPEQAPGGLLSLHPLGRPVRRPARAAEAGLTGWATPGLCG